MPENHGAANRRVEGAGFRGRRKVQADVYRRGGRFAGRFAGWIAA